MKTSLFFDNSVCLRCQRLTGFCPACHNVVALLPQDGGLRCGNPACGASLAKCANYLQHSVCNRCVVVDQPAPTAPAPLCDCCRFNQTIPDLTVKGNAEKWYHLEAAKRRLFYDLDLLGLPYGDDTGAAGRPKLRFDFKADVILKGNYWRPMGKKESVFTGHADGLITINIREADDVERERLRVELGEKHRTLIGHFRHEIAHYYWEVLVKGRQEAECRAVFGDHDNPTYSQALDRHYQEGPPKDWPQRFVSAYASMHPWEDFAETFAAYLDMVSVLDTAHHVEFTRTPPRFGDLDAMVQQYQKLGVAMNEINRSMGLLDLVPEVIVGPVREKLAYVHMLVSSAG